MSVVLYTNGGRGSSNMGVVKALAGPLVSGSIVSVDGWGGFESMRSMFQRLVMSASCNVFVQHTIGNDIYVYVTGDKVGEVAVEGISVANDCNGSGSGFGRVLEFYKANRIVARAEPLQIRISPSSILRGYLIGLRGELVDPATRMFQFQLSFMLVP